MEVKRDAVFPNGERALLNKPAQGFCKRGKALCGT